LQFPVESETFNTLKNQGYHFEHNYGHGKHNLSTVLMLLMFLAFMVDQVQQACCPLFAAVLEKFKSRRALWEKLRSHASHFVFESFGQLWQAMLTGSAMGALLRVVELTRRAANVRPSPGLNHQV